MSKSRNKSAKTVKSPINGAEIVPGNPGNSGGKPGRSGRKPDYIKKLCREVVEDRELVTVLADIADSDSASHRDRISAITKLVEWGYGKPDQVVDVKGEITVKDADTLRDELRARLYRIAEVEEKVH